MEATCPDESHDQHVGHNAQRYERVERGVRHDAEHEVLHVQIRHVAGRRAAQPLAHAAVAVGHLVHRAVTACSHAHAALVSVPDRLDYTLCPTDFFPIPVILALGLESREKHFNLPTLKTLRAEELS